MIKNIFKILFLFFSLGSYAQENFTLNSKVVGNNVIIDVELAKGAKLYWVHPGEAGLPTKIDFDESINLKSAFINWPIPQINDEFNINSYVYTGNIRIPIEVEAIDNSAPIQLKAKMSFAICKETCMQYDEILNQTINIENVKQDFVDKSEIDIKSQSILSRDGKDILSFIIHSNKPILNPQIFLNLPDNFTFNPKKITINKLVEDNNEFIVEVPVLIKDRLIKLDSFSFIIADGEQIHSYVSFLDEREENISIFLILIYALIGGFILNAMPCVLPIISLKLFGILKIVNYDQKRARFGLFAQSIGIIASFLILSIIVYMLKQFGVSVGLGFYFQQPIYIISMILILSIIAINLISDTSFSLNLPDFINRFFPKEERKILDYFLGGIFTTLLAIPCTAPFVTVAVGFALTQNLLTIVLVFSCLGLGMAAPYLLMAINPKSLSNILPKPGPWMEKFRRFIGILVYTTCLWLLYILYSQLGLRAAISVFLLTILLKFFICEKSIKRRFKQILLAFTVIFAFLIPLSLEKQNMEINEQIHDLWKKYNEKEIQKLINDGEVVVVDVTASWCPTCNINKLTTLNNLLVMDFMRKNNVYAFRADISESSPSEIEALMEKHKHYGIPLNIIYSSVNKRGKVLPSILTPTQFIYDLKENIKPNQHN